MSEETETQPVNNDPYREVAIRIVKIVLDNQKSLPPPGVESSRPEAWKEVAGILRTHTAALQRRVEWTTERPTKDGYYFYIDNDSKIIQVFFVGNNLLWVEGYHREWDHFTGLWAGPITEPEPPHEARG